MKNVYFKTWIVYAFVQQYKIVDVNKNLIQNHGSDSEFYILKVKNERWELIKKLKFKLKVIFFSCCY